MTKERFNEIKALFPRFAEAVEFWTSARAIRGSGEVGYPDGVLEGYSKAMIDNGVADARIYVSAMQEIANKKYEVKK